ncbi:MAG: hypothetical protein FJ301_04070 [Planctomycetes bacterium]|nr:hypothetical protein [Planctomycetota bacterium]
MSEVAARLEALRAACARDAAAWPAARAAAMALAAGKLLATPAERVAAAELLVGSDERQDVETAQTLAMASFGALPAARPIAAAAFDRLRLLAGARQKFGTQWVAQDGRWELWVVDETTTDSERAKWGLPALAELRRRAPLA